MFYRGNRSTSTSRYGIYAVFISKDVYTIMDFNNVRIDKSDLEKCRSITGGSLDISGRIKGNIKFPSSKQTYSCNSLISNNIQYDCVLGWDFLVANKLDLSRGNSEGNSCYLLRGRHGKTRVCAKQPSPDIEFTGVIVGRMKQHLISPSLGVKRNQLCYLNHG